MAIASHPQLSANEATNGHQPADVLVVFGITGDLAKVMTFRSLYRLEQRGPAGLPDRRRGGRRLDASTTCASARATSIEAGGEPVDEDGLRALRRAALLRRRATSPTPATFERVAAAIGDAQHAGLLPGDPAVPVRRR